MPDPSLFILIPAYNEERRIEPVLREYADFFGKNYHGKFEIVVVLNGCTDDTFGVVQKVASEYPTVRVLLFPDPIGKGGALIEGLKKTAPVQNTPGPFSWAIFLPRSATLNYN